MIGGWTGKILRVNLTEGSVKVEDLNYELARKFLGGRGLATKYIYDEVDPTIDPLSEENKLIFATGPLTGTYGAANGRYMVVTKAPLTGTIGSSNSGGYFGPELKFAGYDMLIAEGKASKPVYISIYNDQVEIKDASHLWGKTTHETVDALKAEFHGDAEISCIGPAGEKLSYLACVVNDKHRAAGRSGVGAVMGSKNLKAVAVRGTKGVKITDPQAFRNVALEVMGKIKANPVTSGGLPAYGTAVLVNIINETGLFPVNNFHLDVFDAALDISGETLAKTILKRNKGCFGCNIGCGRVIQVPIDGEIKIAEGPEYESIWALGADCGIKDLKAIAQANYLCDLYGMDPISMGGTIACAMELYEKGIIPQKDVETPLRFGDAEAMLKMVEKTGKREGFGDKLALGSYRLAELYNATEYSMTVKRQEFPAYDGRVAQGMALNYATSNRGACHVRGYMTSPEILGIPVKLDPASIEGKAQWVKTMQDLTAVVDSMGICLFLTFAIGAEEIKDFFNTATGQTITADELMLTGERVWNLERLFNLKAGIDPSQDTLPKRILEEPVANGPYKGAQAKLSVLLPEYYKERGWENGMPTERKLKELGLI